MALAFVGSHAFSVFASVLTYRCRQKYHEYHFTPNVRVYAVDMETCNKTAFSCCAKKKKTAVLAVGNKCLYN